MSSQEKLLGANLLICSDNLEEVAKLPKESVDLIYINPPFLHINEVLCKICQFGSINEIVRLF